MIFKNLSVLAAAGVKIHLTIEAADSGQLEVNVLPESATGKTGCSLISKSFIATPEALDEGFAEVIAGYATANLSLKEQLESLQATTAETLKVAQKQAQEAVKSKQATPSRTLIKAKKGEPDLQMDDDGEEEDVSVTETPATPETSVAQPMPFTL